LKHSFFATHAHDGLSLQVLEVDAKRRVAQQFRFCPLNEGSVPEPHNFAKSTRISFPAAG